MSSSIALIAALLMFSIGTVGFMVRKNAIVAFMCIELMLNAVNLTFVAYADLFGNLLGHIAVFFSMVVAAAEASVGLAIIIALFRLTKSTETTSASDLRL